MISPILISVVFTIALWFYLRKSFQRNFINSYQWNKKVIFLFDFNILYCTFFRFLFRYFPNLHASPIFNFLLNFSYVALGFLGLVALILLIIDISHLFELIYLKAFKNPSEKQNHGRREFLKKSFTLGGLGSSFFITGFGYWSSFSPQINKVQIKLEDKFKKLSGLKIAQLSDIHLGPTLKQDFASKLVEVTNELNADLIVITGDMIDGEVDEIKNEVIPLKDLKAPLGVFYVTGNHEYYWNGIEWINFTRSLGIIPLINENRILNFKETQFALCGVTDLYSRKYDPTNASDYLKAKQNVSDDSYKILLAHQPKACFEASKFGYHLQLSGHTHGGQGFPWNLIVYLAQPYLAGLYKHEQMDLFVHKGTGFWGPPNRFIINSEIALIELV